MDRRHTITGALIAGITLAAGAWWWTADYTIYEEIRVNEVEIAGTTYKVTRWEGVISPGAPEKMRACFRVEGPIEAPPELEPRPTPGPGWFKCFNAEFIREQLVREDAHAYVAQSDDPEGYDRVIAILPGNRIYMWRQPNGT